MVILGIDPSLRHTGYGAIAVEGQKTRVLGWGVVNNHKDLLPSRCLLRTFEELNDVIEKYKPDVAAVESVIYLQSHRTAITLGAARGAALLALARAGLTIHEYAPSTVKAASTGQGAAQKAQVGFMMRALLGLTESPPPDAADALAVALTHFQNTRGIRAGTPLKAI